MLMCPFLAALINTSINSFFVNMKKHLAFLFLLSFGLIVSCHKTDSSGPSGVATLSVSRTAIRLDTAIGTIDTLKVHSTIQWTAAISPANSWLKLNTSSGGNGDTVLTLTVISNNGTATPQEATITFSPVNNSQILPVTVTLTEKNYINWAKALGGSKDDEVIDVTLTPDGGSILAGLSNSVNGDVTGNQGALDILIVKLDASGNKQWAKTFGGSGSDLGRSVITTTDGGYIVCGYTTSKNGDVTSSYGGLDAWILKLDASGNKQWAKTFGGSGDDDAFSIITTADGGYTVAGYTKSTDGNITSNHGNDDFWVLKLDASGNTQWSKTYGGADREEANSIVSTTDGGYAVTGFTSSTDGDVAGQHGSIDFWVLKLDASGTKQWAKTFGGSGNDNASTIITTADGGYAVTGYTSSTDGDVSNNHGGSGDFWLLKLDASGTKQWAKTYGGSAYENPNSVVITSDGGYAMAGHTSSTNGNVTNNHGGNDFWVVKVDVSGNEQWAKTFGGSNNDDASAIIATPDGNAVAVGNTLSTDGAVKGNHGNTDIWVLKLNF